MKILRALLLAPLVAAAQSQPIDIKGISIGISRQELMDKVGVGRQFTIAGFQVKSDVFDNVFFHEGKLDSVSFFFTPPQFEDVRGAVKEKYPSLACTNTTVSNAMGGAFDQTECTLSDDSSVLRLTRLVNNNTAVLSLTSKRLLEVASKERAQRKKDI